jgi:uncharacterized protein (DUF1501 family)
LLQSAVFGAGLVGLKSLATGLPSAWFRDGILHAAEPAPPSFLILATVNSGDPFNANAPGAFVGGTEHGADPGMAATDVVLGSAVAKGAQRWSLVPQDLRARMSFIHHRTYSNAHPDYGKVQGLMGAAKAQTGNGQEMIASMFAQENAKALGTIQTEPVALGTELMTYQSRPLTNLKPVDLKSLFASPQDLAAKLQKLRDTELDTMYATLKASGTRYQRTFLDRFALGREQARKLGTGLGALLSRLPLDPAKQNSPADQLLAAVALLQMKVTPAVSVHLPFGGDNHNDDDLSDEAGQTISSIGNIEFLWNELKAAGIQDQTTFAVFNVFGRTLKRNTRGGRDHNGNHHAMMIFGPKVRGSIIGGIAPDGRDFSATAFDSKTGISTPTGDVQPLESLESAAKTLGTALSVPSDVLEHRIQGGKVISAALV